MIVALIGVFLLIYGLWYRFKGGIWTYLTVTGTIYLSSMSTLLVACCYWKRANNWGARRRDPGRRDLSARLPGAGAIRCHEQAGARISARIIRASRRMSAPALAMIIGSLLKPKSRSESQPSEGDNHEAADFWWWLTVACLVWYSTITIFVTVRGADNIEDMLAMLGEQPRRQRQGLTMSDSQNRSPHATTRPAHRPRRPSPAAGGAAAEWLSCVIVWCS